MYFFSMSESVIVILFHLLTAPFLIGHNIFCISQIHILISEVSIYAFSSHGFVFPGCNIIYKMMVNTKLESVFVIHQKGLLLFH